MRFEVSGTSVPIAVCHLSARDVLYARPGRLLWRSGTVRATTKLGRPSTAGPAAPPGQQFLARAAAELLDSGRRALAGRPLQYEHYSVVGTGEGSLGVASSRAGDLVTLELAADSWQVASEAVLIAEAGVAIEPLLRAPLRGGGGGGRRVEFDRLTGSGSVVLAAAGGAYDVLLTAGDELVIRPDALLAFPSSVSFVAALGAMVVLTGSGRVIVQSAAEHVPAVASMPTSAPAAEPRRTGADTVSSAESEGSATGGAPSEVGPDSAGPAGNVEGDRVRHLQGKGNELMGLLDKAREAAATAAAKAQQGVVQGQAKLDEMQTRKQADALLRDLGAAFYSEQRSGGSHEAVMSALMAVDQHVAVNGAIETTPKAGGPSSADAVGAG
ncbi:MAG: AIM24 family protein, partial [Actinomycetota bacterium]|nr:AIM24 family protein [Actinomycetota bacterium]